MRRVFPRRRQELRVRVGGSGRERFARAEQAYEPWRDAQGRLPVTWEVVYAQAWGPQPGTPIRVGGVDEVQVPVGRIPIRRRT